MGRRIEKGMIRGMIMPQERWAKTVGLQREDIRCEQREEMKSSARIRVEASAEEVEGIEDGANNFTSSSWMFFVENSAMNVSVFL